MDTRTIGEMTPQEFLGALSDLTGNGQDDSDNDLGFVDTGSDTQFVFFSRDQFDKGHILDENEEPQPLPGDAMAGYVGDIWYHPKKHSKFGLIQKLRITLEGGPENLMLSTGFFTNASKSLLSGLALVQNPNAVITIEPSLPDDPDDSPNVLFTELYEDGELIQSNGNWPHEDQAVIDLFYEVRENVFGLEPQDVEPQLPDRSGGSSGGRSGNSRNGNSRSRSGNDNSRNGNGRNRSDSGGARSSNRRQSNRGENLQDEEALV